MIYPQCFEQKIGFDHIRTLLKEQCLSPLGTEKVDSMNFSTDHESLREELSRVTEYMRIITEENGFPDQFFFDVRSSLRRVRIEGMYLDEQELFDLRRSLDTIHNIVRFLHAGTEDEDDSPPPYPCLRKLAGEITVFPQLITRIDQILNPYGKIKDNASAELAHIRKELADTLGGISRTLNRILRSAQAEGLVEKDASPAMRDGRLVIPVAPGLKRKVRGIVHDESASGKTVYIEPAEVVEANNRVRELEAEERREIIRILNDFAGLLRPYIPEVLHSYSFLAEIDFTRCKAQFALRTGSIQPALEDFPVIEWTEAIHPLLKISLERQGKTIVPLDIELHATQRILIISGPNAGGKSVCLKTVGLLQYMLQCGLPIPLHERSRAGIFGSIFLDIGDEQSIEDDLSTYSSHLTNMKMMMKHCDAQSLILIDEFGGGTEPQIGGAIAEAVLRRLNSRGTFGVITTHYRNLKHFADANEGVVNGAMLYDRHLMQALFRLQIGNPGSSFAVEIARKIGLPEEVIADASAIVGSEYINADKYLQDIVRDKRYWEQKRLSIRRREKQLEETLARYEEEMDVLKRDRKAIIATAREQAEQMLRESNARIENTIRTIKESQAEREKTRSARRELLDFHHTIKGAEEQAEKAFDGEKENLPSPTSPAKKTPPKSRTAPQKSAKGTASATLVEGQYVRLKGQTAVGRIVGTSGKKSTVVFGNIRTTVETSRLERAPEPPKQTVSTATSFVSLQTREHVDEKKLHFRRELDVRGMRAEEALQAVSHYIDDAILIGIDRARILHGTGTGALRTIIRQYLAGASGIRHYADEHVQFGGAGITVIDFE